MTQQCELFRKWVDAFNGEMEMPEALRSHAAACPPCREYVELQRFAKQVVQSAEVSLPQVPVSAVWARIRRERELGWEPMLWNSFRRLVPIFTAVTALLLIAGGVALRSTANQPTVYEQAWRGAQPGTVAAVAAPDSGAQTIGDLLVSR